MCCVGGPLTTTHFLFAIKFIDFQTGSFVYVLPMVAFMLQQGSVVLTDLLALKYLLPDRLQKKITSSCKRKKKYFTQRVDILFLLLSRVEGENMLMYFLWCSCIFIFAFNSVIFTYMGYNSIVVLVYESRIL